MRPTRAVINFKNLEHNMKLLSEKAGGRLVVPIIKADAYGHGVVPVLHKLIELGYTHFGVATLEEAFELRAQSQDISILVIGDTVNEDFGLAADHKITFTLHNESGLVAYEALGRSDARVHLKIDSGMHRIGFTLADVERLKDRLAAIKPSGIFTHMAKADEVDKSSAMKQLAIFKQAVEMLQGAGADFEFIHYANSASILELDLSFSNLVRAGISLYGLNPSGEVGHDDLRPLMSWYTEIVDLRLVPAGEGVSYSHIFVPTRDTLVATLPVGYADGYKRQMSKKARVYINGTYCPVIGRITMDQIMVDVTDVPGVKLRDTVELMGEHVPCDELAGYADTINYEIVTNLGKRVRREYTEGV